MAQFDHTPSTMWIILIIVLSTVSAQQNIILTPPNDVTGKFGKTAEFRCHIEFGGIPSMIWEFNHKSIYSLHHDQEAYPMGKAKYSVTQDGQNFTLEVRDLHYADGGIYSCLVLDQTAKANLIVIGKPHLFNTTTNPVEGSTVEFICTVQFGGPRKEEILPQHYPWLRMFLAQDPLNETVIDQEPEDSGINYNLTQIQNLTLEASLYGMTLGCEVRTSDPMMQWQVTTEIEVLYSVRNISYTPFKVLYEVGTVLNCSADGNPKPEVQWDNRKAGNFTQRWLLEVTKEMIGSNTKRCIARNNISGHSYEDSIVAIFDAVLRKESEEVTISSRPTESGNDFSRIGVPVAITVSLLLIGCFIAFVGFRRKRKSDGKDEDARQPLMQKAEARNAQLVKLIASLGHKDHLTDQTAENIKRLLPDEAFPEDTPSALVLFIYKSKYLMESDQYHTLMQEMVAKYEKNQDNIVESPLLPLVELIEEQSVIQNHSKLIRLLQILIPLHSHADTRTKCMRALITRTREWKILKGENVPINSNSLQWNNDLIEILKELLKGQADAADPAWSPNESSEGSILHMFMKVVVQVVMNKPDLFENILPLLERMMTDSAVSCDNVDGDGKTVLHSFVAGMKVCLTAVPPCDISKIISQVKAKNSALLDTKDKSNCAPLHIFINTAFPVNRYNLSEELLQLTKKIILLLRSDVNVNFQVNNSSNIHHMNSKGNSALHCFIPSAGNYTSHSDLLLETIKQLKPTNIDFQNDEHETALHLFTANVADWLDKTDLFMNVIESLKSGETLEMKNVLGNTPLHAFTSTVGEWTNHPEDFLKVVSCLKSDTNRDIMNIEGETPLHIFISNESEWEDNPVEFLEVIECLKSSGNIEFQNVDGATALHVFASKAGEWRYHSKQIKKVINYLRSYTNIESKTRSNETVLHVFASKAGEWKDHPREFLEVLKSLISPENLNIWNVFLETALHIFTSKARQWRHHPNSFLEVIRYLVSTTNIKMQNIRGATALQKFTSYADVWKDCPEKFLEVVNFLKIRFPTSIDFQDKDKDTPLHSLFFSFINWSKSDNHDMLVKVAKSYSEAMNVDMQVKKKKTQLTFTLMPKDGYFPESLLDFLAKFSTNTKVIEKMHGEREMHIITSSRGKWGESPHFLKLVRCLVSTNNINIQDYNKDTPLHCFARCKSEWANHKDIVEIVKLLISQKNITMENKDGVTAMNLIEKNWADHDGLQKILEMASNQFQYVTNMKKT